jgi:hypothetical protein
MYSAWHNGHRTMSAGSAPRGKVMGLAHLGHEEKLDIEASGLCDGIHEF